MRRNAEGADDAEGVDDAEGADDADGAYEAIVPLEDGYVVDWLVRREVSGTSDGAVGLDVGFSWSHFLRAVIKEKFRIYGTILTCVGNVEGAVVGESVGPVGVLVGLMDGGLVGGAVQPGGICAACPRVQPYRCVSVL